MNYGQFVPIAASIKIIVITETTIQLSIISLSINIERLHNGTTITLLNSCSHNKVPNFG
ncbi:hypothetical protein D3C81_772990 [compost metagenome]